VKLTNELLDKRAELAARRDTLKADLAKLDDDLLGLDRVLALFDPDYQPATGRRRRKTGDGFSRGELSEGILEALRDASEPITVAQCAEALAERKGIPAENLTRFKANVSAAMTYLAKRNRVRRIHNGDGRNVAWEVAR
jgi:hypothetical protein